MHRSAGVIVLVVSSVIAMLAAFPGRTRHSAGFIAAVLAVAGAGVGLGAALVEGEGGTAQAAAAIVVLAALTPMHVRVLLGPLGRPR